MDIGGEVAAHRVGEARVILGMLGLIGIGFVLIGLVGFFPAGSEGFLEMGVNLFGHGPIGIMEAVDVFGVPPVFFP